MSRGIVIRAVYVRVQVDGKKKLIRIGSLDKKGGFRLDKGAPLPGGFEGLFRIDNSTISSGD